MLHGNVMQPLTSSIVDDLREARSLQHLHILALNRNGLRTWNDVLALESLLPQLQELYLAQNDLRDIPCDGRITNRQCFMNLSVLDISHCGIVSWSQVLYFSSLPKLADLQLDGNSIDSVEMTTDESDGPASCFENLQRLSLSSCGITSWRSLDELSRIAALRSLRMSHVQLFAGKGASEVRPLVIARIPQLTFFNGSGISSRERTDSEKSYVRRLLREIEDAEAAREKARDDSVFRLPTEKSIRETVVDEVEAANPRFRELRAKYDMDVGCGGAYASSSARNTIAADLITVTINNFTTSGEYEPVSKRLPTTLRIANLKLMIKQLFGVDPSLQLLALQLYSDSPPTPLDDDDSSLGYFGAIEGARIVVNEAKAE